MDQQIFVLSQIPAEKQAKSKNNSRAENVSARCHCLVVLQMKCDRMRICDQVSHLTSGDEGWMSAANENVEYPEATQRSGYRYFFFAKHHGGDTRAAMWLTSISREVEFSIFDHGDLRDIADNRGWIYGVLLDDEGDLREIGTWEEQVAEFRPGVSLADPWHGYPQWPVDKLGPANRRRQQSCPDRVVFDLMVAAAMIDRIQRKRLLSGRNA
jgi:hypothetical protein